MNKSIVILPGTELESGIAQQQCAHLPIRLPVFQSRLLLHTLVNTSHALLLPKIANAIASATLPKFRTQTASELDSLRQAFVHP